MRDITEITSPPQFSAAPVRIRPQRSFETAKAQVSCFLAFQIVLSAKQLGLRVWSLQVDADLHSFRCEVANQLLAEAGQPGLADDGILSR